MVRPMVHSTKHYVQTSISLVTGGAKAEVSVIDAVAVSDKDALNEVEEGSSVKAVYFEHWLKAAEASNISSFTFAIYKAPSGLAAFSVGQLAALGNADNKKNVLYTSQGLLNTEASQATNVIKGWIKIPKSKQRFGLGDKLFLSISAVAIDVRHCGLAIYKEYS